MSERAERIEAAFNGLTKDTMDILDGFYASDVIFVDPLVRVEGLPDLKAYYRSMYENVEAIRFDFGEQVIDGDTHAAAWTMRMRVKNFNKGREIVLDGVSIVRFGQDGLVVYHQDYFDVGAMVYEHVPVVRFFVRQVKKRLQEH